MGESDDSDFRSDTLGPSISWIAHVGTNWISIQVGAIVRQQQILQVVHVAGLAHRVQEPGSTGSACKDGRHAIVNRRRKCVR